MNDTEKIAAIKKRIVKHEKIETIEDGLELLSDIIHIVYGVDKKKPLFEKKSVFG